MKPTKRTTPKRRRITVSEWRDLNAALNEARNSLRLRADDMAALTAELREERAARCAWERSSETLRAKAASHESNEAHLTACVAELDADLRAEKAARDIVSGAVETLKTALLDEKAAKEKTERVASEALGVIRSQAALVEAVVAPAREPEFAVAR